MASIDQSQPDPQHSEPSREPVPDETRAGAPSGGGAGGEGEKEQRIVVVTQDGMGVAEQGDDQESPTEQIEQPAKVMRIGTMIKSLLEEVRNAPLDDAGRARLAEIHRRSLAELKQGLAPELIAELDRIALPFGDAAPTDAELRIAQAQLVGWLEGLFHGIQTALFAQQMAAQQQLAGMRRGLPPGMTPEQAAAMLQQQQQQAQQGQPGQSGGAVPGAEHGPASGPTGQYL